MADVSKHERTLLVVANLSTWGQPRLQWLYEWLDQNAVTVARLMMGPCYRQIQTLTGAETTRSNFVERIIRLAEEPQTKVLDVFLSLHGLDGVLYFEDGPVESAAVGEELGEAELKHRLRLLYSTACYGATHAADFVNAGFRVASGAMALNANGPYDFPTQLLHWRRGETYRLAVKRANNRVFIDTHDAIARGLGFTDVNSEKAIEGKKLTRITSAAE